MTTATVSMEDLSILAQMARNVVESALRECERCAAAGLDRDLERAWETHARALKVTVALARMAAEARPWVRTVSREWCGICRRATDHVGEHDGPVDQGPHAAICECAVCAACCYCGKPGRYVQAGDLMLCYACRPEYASVRGY